MLTQAEYIALLKKAIDVRQSAEQMRVIGETDEVRELIANLQLGSGRLVKILAKRVAGNVQEA